MSRYGMIAGNGRFPLLALETARAAGDQVVVLAIKEEASPDVEQLAERCYWISLGQLSRLIEILKEEGITEVMMAGQVKHAKIFSSIRPDWKLVKLLASLKQKTTDALIGFWPTKAFAWRIPRCCSSRCLRARAFSASVSQHRTRSATSPMAEGSQTPWPA
jgi:hypothetical protein